MKESDIAKCLTNNDALFNKVHTLTRKFDILPDNREHIGATIKYQDLTELSDEFIEELVDSVVDWVYSSEEYKKLVKTIVCKGKSESAAHSEVLRKAKQKFRKSEDELLIQGQLGELLLFHFIQRFFGAAPLLRKMKITLLLSMNALVQTLFTIK